MILSRDISTMNRHRENTLNEYGSARDRYQVWRRILATLTLGLGEAHF
jgi:hypothetical protein